MYLSYIGDNKMLTNFEIDEKITLIPEGVFEVNDTIVMNDGLIKGAGIDKTILVADFDDPKKAIFHMGWTSKLEDMTICFKQGILTGNELAGERVAIYTKSCWPLQKGAYIKNVKIDNVGTGICSVDDPSITFSVMYKNVTVTNFSFRGFDISSPFRTGNIYSNITLSSGRFNCDSAFYFGSHNSGDEESETAIENLLIYDTVSKIPLNLESARGIIAKKITLDNVSAEKSYVFWQDADGCIDELTIKNCNVSCESIINVGTPFKLTQWGGQYLRIKNLILQDVKNFGDKNKLFCGMEAYETPYYITVDNYLVEGCENSFIFESFPVSGELTFTKRAAIK